MKNNTQWKKMLLLWLIPGVSMIVLNILWYVVAPAIDPYGDWLVYSGVLFWFFPIVGPFAVIVVLQVDTIKMTTIVNLI